MLSMRWPATSIVPLVGRSRPARRLSSVDLPDPDGPISARNSPSSILRSRRFKTLMSSLPRWNCFSTLRMVTSWLAMFLLGCAVARLRGCAARRTPRDCATAQLFPDLHPIPILQIVGPFDDHALAVRHSGREARVVAFGGEHAHRAAFRLVVFHHEHDVLVAVAADAGLRDLD